MTSTEGSGPATDLAPPGPLVDSADGQRRPQAAGSTTSRRCRTLHQRAEHPTCAMGTQAIADRHDARHRPRPPATSSSKRCARHRARCHKQTPGENVMMRRPAASRPGRTSIARKRCAGHRRALFETGSQPVPAILAAARQRRPFERNRSNSTCRLLRIPIRWRRRSPPLRRRRPRRTAPRPTRGRSDRAHGPFASTFGQRRGALSAVRLCSRRSSTPRRRRRRRARRSGDVDRGSARKRDRPGGVAGRHPGRSRPRQHSRPQRHDHLRREPRRAAAAAADQRDPSSSTAP